MTRSGQRGFTLIELMVALLVSSLLVGMILAIFSRMSLAYRGQQQIAGVQQVLAAARSTIELDAKQAGLGMPQGFTTAITGAGVLQSPVQVTNANNAPDQIAFFYADTSIQALVTDGINFFPTQTLVVDQTTGFVADTLAVVATASTMGAPGRPAGEFIATYQTCVLRIAVGGITPNSLRFENVAPWGPVANAGCATPIDRTTMVYPLVAHAYRIDTTNAARAALGALQLSTNGGLLGVNDVWTELAYGFSDIQTAVRLQDNSPVDSDGLADANRNWYSGGNQDLATRLPATPAGALLLQMSISLLARTDRDVEGIATPATPALIGAIVNFNNLGDRPSTVLPVGDPPWPDPLLPGRRIYRYTTFQVDFRNLGVGQ